ncbi:MAG: prolipoprotein diacylglyceryl transferase, partial [SAR324 cluster bacterium]|nr:prolipoprotein diacylglyceryl transferase [SAR324 cluster bacterium]
IGIIFACVYFARKNKISILHCMDLCALCSGPGIFFGRIANFINGELVGREAPSWLKWGVRFPQDILSWPSHDTERLLSLSPIVEKLGASKEYWQHAVENLPNSHSAQVFINSMLSRIIDAVQHSNIAIMDTLAPILTLRHPSQIYEALMEGLIVFLLLLFVWRKARKPGIISGYFLIFYSAVRIFCEEFRMPDLQIGFQLFGLTRGQWLSIIMISLGMICIIYWAKRPVEKLGGWLDSQ